MSIKSWERDDITRPYERELTSLHQQLADVTVERDAAIKRAELAERSLRSMEHMAAWRGHD